MTEHEDVARWSLDGKISLDADRILCNDVIAAGESNPHKVGLWVIEGLYGPAAAVWESNEQDALDEAADADLMRAFHMDDDDVEDRTDENGDEEFARLGNEGDPYDLNDCHIRRIAWKDIPEETQEAFLLARDEGLETLADLDDLEEEDDEDEDDESLGEDNSDPDREDFHSDI